MTHYDDVIMPTGIGFGSVSTPATATDLVFAASGKRFARQRRAARIRRLDLDFTKPFDAALLDIDLREIAKIHEALDGPFNTFLARDWAHWNTSGQQGPVDGDPDALLRVATSDAPMRNTVTGLLVGDGSTTTFQLELHTTKGSATHARVITKPQSPIVAENDSIAKIEGVDFTVDYATGIVTWSPALGVGVVPKWGGAFYLKVAFVNDELPSTLGSPAHGSLSGVALVEVP
jgi:uncharacterized protein (TIGR02217 family)